MYHFIFKAEEGKLRWGQNGCSCSFSSNWEFKRPWDIYTFIFSNWFSCLSQLLLEDQTYDFIYPIVGVEQGRRNWDWKWFCKQEGLLGPSQYRPPSFVLHLPIVCRKKLGSEAFLWSRICLWGRRPGFNLWVGKFLRRREWQSTPVFLPGEFHGQRSLPGRLQSVRSQRVRHSWVTNTT